MVSAALLLVSVLRSLIEVAGLCLLGQGVLALLAGSRREGNPIYQMFRIVTRPALLLMRRLAPRVILDRHLPLLTFFVLFWLWIILAYLRQLIALEAN